MHASCPPPVRAASAKWKEVSLLGAASALVQVLPAHADEAVAAAASSDDSVEVAVNTVVNALQVCEPCVNVLSRPDWLWVDQCRQQAG